MPMLMPSLPEHLGRHIPRAPLEDLSDLPLTDLCILDQYLSLAFTRRGNIPLRGRRIAVLARHAGRVALGPIETVFGAAFTTRSAAAGTDATFDRLAFRSVLSGEVVVGVCVAGAGACLEEGVGTGASETPRPSTHIGLEAAVVVVAVAAVGVGADVVFASFLRARVALVLELYAAAGFALGGGTHHGGGVADDEGDVEVLVAAIVVAFEDGPTLAVDVELAGEVAEVGTGAWGSLAGAAGVGPGDGFGVGGPFDHHAGGGGAGGWGVVAAISSSIATSIAIAIAIAIPITITIACAGSRAGGSWSGVGFGGGGCDDLGGG